MDRVSAVCELVLLLIYLSSTPHVLCSKQVWSVALRLDGARVVSGAGDSTIRIWDTAAGTELSKTQGHLDWVD